MKSLTAYIYMWRHPGVSYESVPYWYKRTIFGELWHLIRKKICVVWAPNCTITSLRLALYRLCGLKIGKGTFIGMKCYVDDLCIDKIEIGNNCTISYGVYFACHGINQPHNKIIIHDHAYIGMRSSIIAPCDIEIGEYAIVGSQTLVNKPVPPHSTVVGIPCRVIKNNNIGKGMK